MQECEVPTNLNEQSVSSKNYKIELESNDYKKRAGIYIRNNVQYRRMSSLEEKNNNIVIIDILSSVKYRLINVYRSFSSPDNRSPQVRFEKQLDLIKIALADKSLTPIIIGDFNLDFRKETDPYYGHHVLYESLISTFEPLGLIQLINFETWTRFVNGVKRSSIIDHIYANDPFVINNIQKIETEIGDHCLITCQLETTKTPLKIVMKRDWRMYNKDILIEKLLRNHDTTLQPNNVQCAWNYFENLMINVIDEILPLCPFTNDEIKKKITFLAVKNSA